VVHRLGYDDIVVLYPHVREQLLGYSTVYSAGMKLPNTETYFELIYDSAILSILQLKQLEPN
jgi:hypothetical protein